MAENRCVARLAALRGAMERNGVDTVIIPTADYHNSEYVADCFKAREYYSGFTGSAGILAVRGEEAALWADGRYFIQAEHELAGSGITLMKMGEPGVPTLHEWLKAEMPENSRLAFDGRCITKAEGQAFAALLGEKKVEVSAEKDLAGDTWENRPALPKHPVFLLDAEKYAGESAESKLKRLRGKMAEKNVTAYVSSKLDEIMWLFNIRGNDVECNPVALSYAVVTKDKALLYLQDEEVTGELKEYAKEAGITLRSYEHFLADLPELPLGEEAAAGAAAGTSAAETVSAADGTSAAETVSAADGEKQAAVRVWIDPDYTSFSVYCALRQNLDRTIREELKAEGVDLAALPKAAADKILASEEAKHFVETPSPVDFMKSIRNETEIRNFRDIYVEDSAALTKFIYWLKKSMKEGAQLTEGSAAAYLDQLRAGISDYVELSFPTISAYGSNAAMMHYEPGEDGGAALSPEGMLLVDSGGHYLRGTTDVTRTMSLGPVTDEMRRSYTLTAVSQLQLMGTVFLKGCNGIALDIMAREPMWENGMDYKCGTGHGIGYLLNVHEGPQTIRWREREKADSTPLEAGMVVSDEPGVYREGAYGIRIETILLCREWGTTPDGTFLCFEPLTFAPLDRDLIDPSVLTPHTRKLLNDYHRSVLEKISPYLNEEEKLWLSDECAEI